jgi:hypothetical protein
MLDPSLFRHAKAGELRAIAEIGDRVRVQGRAIEFDGEVVKFTWGFFEVRSDDGFSFLCDPDAVKLVRRAA